MRRDVQDIFRLTPHEKQVMMFSATLSKEVRPVCKKFMQDVSTSMRRARVVPRCRRHRRHRSHRAVAGRHLLLSRILDVDTIQSSPFAVLSHPTPS